MRLKVPQVFLSLGCAEVKLLDESMLEKHCDSITAISQAQQLGEELVQSPLHLHLSVAISHCTLPIWSERTKSCSLCWQWKREHRQCKTLLNGQKGNCGTLMILNIVKIPNATKFTLRPCSFSYLFHTKIWWSESTSTSATAYKSIRSVGVDNDGGEQRTMNH